MNRKKFIITIDTEGDNLWSWKPGDKINTENTLFLPRFQFLCEKFGFKPTYLTNYEMVKDARFVDFAKDLLKRKTCEVGMHLHAWNTPPEYSLKNKRSRGGAPYLIEYPESLMEEKIKIMTQVLEDTFQEKMLSHRAGRWAMNQTYYKLLMKHGYRFDCSVTPHIDWSRTPGETEKGYGTNYKDSPEKPYIINSKDNNHSIIEVPMSIRSYKQYISTSTHSMKQYASALYNMVKGRTLWFRPGRDNLSHTLYLANQLRNEDTNYIMFMLHSSELMPGGSPTFRSSDEIEHLYDDLEILFETVHEFCEGIMLRNFEARFVEV
jgi:hypothetical protein